MSLWWKWPCLLCLVSMTSSVSSAILSERDQRHGGADFASEERAEPEAVMYLASARRVGLPPQGAPKAWSHDEAPEVVRNQRCEWPTPCMEGNGTWSNGRCKGNPSDC